MLCSFCFTCDNNSDSHNIVIEEIFEVEKEYICPICISRKRKKKLIALECGHVFHKKCIKGWLKKNQSCPMCRLELI